MRGAATLIGTSGEQCQQRIGKWRAVASCWGLYIGASQDPQNHTESVRITPNLSSSNARVFGNCSAINVDEGRSWKKVAVVAECPANLGILQSTHTVFNVISMMHANDSSKIEERGGSNNTFFCIATMVWEQEKRRQSGQNVKIQDKRMLNVSCVPFRIGTCTTQQTSQFWSI